MTDLVTYVCSGCGSSDIEANGVITWDTRWQVWVADCPDSGTAVWCRECDTLVGEELERPLNIKEIAQVAIKKQEATQ